MNCASARLWLFLNVERETLQSEVLREIKYGSKVFTDENVGYENLRHKYVHEVVTHGIVCERAGSHERD